MRWALTTAEEEIVNNEPLQKTDFGSIYDRPDPRAYYTTLAEHEYEIPQHGADVFRALQQERHGPTPPTMLDLCCSYGVVGALMKTDLSFDDLTDHYRDHDERGTSRQELIDADRRLLQERRRPDAPRVIGFDVAQNAIDYATASGALDQGFAVDLESNDPTQSMADELAEIDLITTTGGIGYVTEWTFKRLLDIAPPDVWVAAFCLRTYDYAPIAADLDNRGFTTERAPRTYRQRRFTDPEEQAWAVAQVRARGLEPAGLESAGHYHADLFVSRPAEAARARPLESLLP